MRNSFTKPRLSTLLVNTYDRTEQPAVRTPSDTPRGTLRWDVLGNIQPHPEFMQTSILLGDAYEELLFIFN